MAKKVSIEEALTLCFYRKQGIGWVKQSGGFIYIVTQNLGGWKDLTDIPPEGDWIMLSTTPRLISSRPMGVWSHHNIKNEPVEPYEIYAAEAGITPSLHWYGEDGNTNCLFDNEAYRALVASL